MPYRLAILLAALVLTVSGTVAADARSSPIACRAPADYMRLLRTAYSAAAHGDQIGLAEASPGLIATKCVKLASGDSAPVENSWLAQALNTPRPNLPQIAARLGALIDALSYPSEPAAADAEQRLRAILSQPPFAQPERDQGPGWLERFLQWLDDLFGDIFIPADQVRAEAGPGLSWLITLVGLLAIGVVLIVWLRGLRLASARHIHQPTDDPEAKLSADEATRQASDLAHAGDYRRAVRMLYLSALLWLHEQGRLRYDRSLTNREHLDRLGEQTALHEQLRPVVETFDGVWYGDLPLDATGFAAYKRQVEALRDV